MHNGVTLCGRLIPAYFCPNGRKDGGTIWGTALLGGHKSCSQGRIRSGNELNEVTVLYLNGSTASPGWAWPWQKICI